MLNSSIDQWSQTIWNYHLLHQMLERADILLVLGSHDLRVATYNGLTKN